VGAVSFLIISNLKINQKRTELLNRIDSLKAEIQILEEQSEELQSGLTEIETEAYWEEKAREQGYKKPGEEQVVVLPPEETEEVPEVETSIWQKIKNWFKRD